MNYEHTLLKVNLGSDQEPHISYIALTDIQAMSFTENNEGFIMIGNVNAPFILTGDDDKAKVLARWANAKRRSAS